MHESQQHRDSGGVIVSTSDNEIDMADLGSLGDTKVGIIVSQGRCSVLPDSFEMIGFFNRVLLKHLVVDRMYRMRRNQWQALTTHQSKKDEDGHEFQDYVFTIAADENCKIFGGSNDQGSR